MRLETPLFACASSLYAASTALAFAYAASRREAFARGMWRLLATALLLHAASLGLRTQLFWTLPEHRWRLPLHTGFGMLSGLAFANALIFWLVEGCAQLHILGAFILPWTTLAAWTALLCADPALAPLPQALRSSLMNLHPPLLMAAYSGFANAFGAGLALFIQERQLKSRRPAQICYRLPAVEELDRLQGLLVLASFLLLSAGIALGALWSLRVQGAWRQDAKVLFTLLTWLVYAAVLALRPLGVRGRRGTLLAMCAFLVLLAAAGLAGDAFSHLHKFLM